jgi:sulfonate transport system substrate-binding protein
MNRRHFIAAAMAVLLNGVVFAQDYGKPGGPVTVVIGYQPYYTQSWSGVVMRGKKFYEKYLPNGCR